MLKVGDIVYLKSGSPKMTIIEVRGGPASFMVKVAWIDYNSGLVKKLTAPSDAFKSAGEAGVDNGIYLDEDDEVYEGHNEPPGH